VNDDSYIVIVNSNSDDNKSFEDAEESLKDGEEEEGFEDALESLPDEVKDKFDMKEISDKLAR
jgi:DNA-directed RNA polymerase specialized sigma24 family protein